MKNKQTVFRAGPRNRLFLCFLWLGILCSAGRLDAQEKSYFISNGRKVDIRQFDQTVRDMIADVGIPGASLAIIDEGRVVYSQAYGRKQLSRGGRVNKQTVFEACSLSKSFLVYVVFKLVDEGRLDLDRPMYQYLDPGAVLNHDSRYKQITPWMVLSHCSGLENWKEDNNPDTLDILSNPGEKFIYSGTGYNYLAAVVEKLLNEPYEKYIPEMELQPLGLRNSYLDYRKLRLNPFHRSLPWNYAVGHNAFGEEIGKVRNTSPVPSSYNSTTADDYARLVLSIFDRKHLSGKSVDYILQPRIRTITNKPNFYGTGFEILYVDNDTIIAHGGSNPGFKGQLFYSVTKKRGFVFLTNSDRGKLITTRLCDLTAGLNIRQYYEEFAMDQYPSAAITLFHRYRTSGADTMLAEIATLRKEHRLQPNTLNELANDLMSHDAPTAQKLLWENIGLFPDASISYFLLGNLYRSKDMVDSAYANYRRAKECHFTLWPDDLTRDLRECEEKIADDKRRSPLLTTIGGEGWTTIRAEDYNAMYGIELQDADDTANAVRHCVGYIDNGDWMDYRVQVISGGHYTAAIRVANLSGKGWVELRMGDTVLSRVNIPVTHEPARWVTVRVDVALPEGTHTLRLWTGGRGGFRISRVAFGKTSAISKK